MRHFLMVMGFLFISFIPSIYSQQSFFNVPSSDITPKGKLFFQQQVNFLPSSTQLNTTFSYGLGNNWECGVNMLGITHVNSVGFVINDTLPPYSPLICVNAQKKIHLNDNVSLASGTQIGMNNENTLSAYAYLNSIMHLHNSLTKIVTGLYYSSDGFLGSEQRSFFSEGLLKYFGLQIGLEQVLIENKLVLQSDLISGKHAMGENVTGFAYFIDRQWIFSTGYQLPLFNSTSQKAIVFELTYSPEHE